MSEKKGPAGGRFVVTIPETIRDCRSPGLARNGTVERQRIEQHVSTKRLNLILGKEWLDETE